MYSKRQFKDAKPLDANAAFQYAIRALSQRALTELEIIKRLQSRDTPADIIQITLDRLRYYNFLNDAAIAQRSVRETKMGSRVIRMKLQMRGLDTQLIDDALSIREPDADLEAARVLARRYGSRWFGERGYAKAYAFLARRGFDGGVIQNVMRELKLEALESIIDAE